MHSLELVSHRRPVTEEEKEKALRMAVAASSEDSLITVMQAAQVYEKFYMVIQVFSRFLPSPFIVFVDIINVS